MDTKWTFLSGMGVGAAVMFFLEPSGHRRRALLRDKTGRAGRTVGRASARASRHLYNRSRGLVFEAAKRIRDDHPSSEVLSERVRSGIGRVVSDPGAIEVMADQGRVTLRGPVLANELAALLRKTRRVRGVHQVANDLTVHDEPGRVPALQGHRPWIRVSQWSPRTRLLSGIAAGTVAVFAVAKRVA